MSCTVLALVAAFAAAPAPAPSTALTSTAAAADATLRAARLLPGTTDYDGSITRASGLDPDRLAAHLDALTAVCPDAATPCAALDPHADLLARLARALAELGAARHAPSLLRSHQRGSYEAGVALDRLRLRTMLDALPRARCAPPDAAAVTTGAAALSDFLVVRIRDGVPVAEPLRPAERDDLAYFLAAVAQSGREVGVPAEASAGDPWRPGPPDAARAEALQRFQQALAAGQLAAALTAGRSYLASFGYPRPMHLADESEHAWGGARVSYVMRDLAGLAELTGELTLAADLYRRADPGGGVCGTSYWSIWQSQIEGTIRTAERLGDCRLALAERLLDVDVSDSSDPAPPDPRGLGTGRLTAAGFDVPRLYRGALLTLGRDDEPTLRRALAAAPANLRGPALARLARLGREDWARRVYALAGAAATGDLRTLTALAATLPTLDAGAQAQLLTAIGEAGERPPHDPCDPKIGGHGFGSGSNMWTRPVPMYGRTCAGSLTVAESEALARSVLPALSHPDERVQEAAITALGKLGVGLARPPLRKLARAAPTTPCNDAASCTAVHLHAAAVDALATLDAAPGDPRWRRFDGKRHPPR